MANPRGSVVIAGKYRLGRALARGGMGAVWQAHHLQLDIPVAIKFMDASMTASADARARFEREARAAAMLRSPHVVHILDHGVDGGMHYIVMELLEGENLGDRLHRDRRLTIPDAANIALQVLKALRRAHDAGIVHRDLKPTNIFLAQIDDEEIVKVLDFGIAKAALSEGSNEVTKTGVLLGSPSYMSPEQARDIKSVDHRADLWSLSVILFRALTGEVIFHGETNVDLLLQLCNDPVPKATSVAPDLPKELDRFFERAFCRDLNGRFQSAREMAQALVDVVQRLGFGDEIAPSMSQRFGARTSDVGRASTPPMSDALGSRSSSVPPQSEPRLLQLLRKSVPPPPPASPSPQVSDLIDEGFSALRAGDRDTARRCWSEALGLDPSNRMIELNLRRLDAFNG